MTEQNTEQVNTDTTQAEVKATEPDTQQQDATTPQPEQQDTTQEGDQEPDPRISKLNQEAAKWRKQFRDQEKANADLQAQFDEFRQSIVQAIGGNKESTPEQIVEEAQQKQQEAEGRYRSLQQKLALHDAIRAAGADPDLAVPFIRGGDKFATLDPSAEDYEAQVAALVAETVDKFPKLRAQAAPPTSGNTSTPSENSTREYTREDLQGMSAEEINRLYREGKLKNLTS
ncbi:hypothetical protein HMPREF2998_00550 [Corynebacterium sp. HMSC065A05]|uniref:hypothetical protein n=1 Tax=Corynebacterium sp. HMSC065A05 TaxID=1739502 RepID=UPI0008A563B4|nr:hypothetical protein [Corynebacterium sp. HMSC065A05]OFP16008.1 hypothetical protein HMPREF2998_00550 [Corynebacterium sp. HMSC065A05]